jgi:dethiobiotin synthetase
MSKSIFITGTGTDVGKTYVSGLIVKKLRGLGINAGYYKPVLSGAEYLNKKLVPGDCFHVAERAGLDIDPAKLTSYMFKTPVSPHLAAALEDRGIEPHVIADGFAKFRKEYEYLTIEGCGGIVCPLRIDEKIVMQTDIIKLLDLNLLIVAPSGLGTINSTVLTVQHAENTGLYVEGIILNKYDSTDFMHRDNKNMIEKITKIPVIASIPVNSSDIEIDHEVLCGIYKEDQ